MSSAKSKFYYALTKDYSDKENSKYFDLYKKTGDPKYKNELITRNFKIVNDCFIKYVKDYKNREDWIQEGILILSQAIDKYDPEKKVLFSTFVHNIIYYEYSHKLRKTKPANESLEDLGDRLDKMCHRDCEEKAEFYKKLHEILNSKTFNFYEREIIKLRFGLGDSKELDSQDIFDDGFGTNYNCYSLKQISEMLSIPYENLFALYRKGMTKLKHKLHVKKASKDVSI